MRWYSYCRRRGSAALKLIVAIVALEVGMAGWLATPAIAISLSSGAATATTEKQTDETAGTFGDIKEPHAVLSLSSTNGCRRTCDFKDPATFKIYYSGCSSCYRYCADDGQSVRFAPFEGPTWVRLRYSPWCRTVWSKPTSTDYYPEVISYYLSGARRTSAEGYVSSGPWSQMLDDADLLGQACAWYGPGGACTSTY